MDQYGLIGYPLSHSFSKKFFTEKFSREKIEAAYELYPLTSISELTSVLKTPFLKGLNITIPYKKQVMDYLHQASPEVSAMGACNCIKITEGKLIGYNTDVIGFERTLLKQLEPHHNKALILGTGGAAEAVKFVLKKLGIDFLMVSRNEVDRENYLTYSEINNDILSTYKLIVNTTPLGMYPNVDSCPDIPYNKLTPQHYLYDLIYNPAKTTFLQKGEEKGAVIENGEQMLVIQAEESWKIWNER